MTVISQDGRFFTDSAKVDYWEIWPQKPDLSAGGFHIRIQIRGREYYNLTLGHFRCLDAAIDELARLASMIAAGAETIYQVRPDPADQKQGTQKERKRDVE